MENRGISNIKRFIQ